QGRPAVEQQHTLQAEQFGGRELLRLLASDLFEGAGTRFQQLADPFALLAALRFAGMAANLLSVNAGIHLARCAAGSLLKGPPNAPAVLRPARARALPGRRAPADPGGPCATRRPAGQRTARASAAPPIAYRP